MRTVRGVVPVLCAAVLLIIVGLLGMHTFSANSSGHGQTAPMSHETGAAHRSAADSQPAAALDGFEAHHASQLTVVPVLGADHGVLAQPDPGTHDGMMLTCVLALLAALMLLAAPIALGWIAPFRALLADGPALLRTSVPQRPPSLHVLSISRT